MESQIEGISGAYALHLEFADKPTGIGEKIRNLLREKYIREKLRSGPMQTEPEAAQYPSPKGETEGRRL